MSAGAAERDGEIALAFANVVRDQVNQQLRDAIDKLAGLRKRPDIAHHAGIPARQILELRNVVGIRQEADVEDQVAVGWNAMPVSKAGDVDPETGFVAAAAKLFP